MRSIPAFMQRWLGTHHDVVVRLAVRLLPPGQRDRRAEEWAGDLQAAAAEGMTTRDIAVGAVKTAAQVRIREEIRQSNLLRTAKIVSLFIFGVCIVWPLLLDFHYSLYQALIWVACGVGLFSGVRKVLKKPVGGFLARMAITTVLLHGVSAAAMVYLTSWRIPESFTSLAEMTQHRDQWIWEPTWLEIQASFIYPAPPYPLGAGLAVHSDDAIFGAINWFGAWGAFGAGIVTCVILLGLGTRLLLKDRKTVETSKMTA